jgi:hypothetical protein
MWEPRRLTALWASTACHGDSSTFFTISIVGVDAVQNRGLYWAHNPIGLQGLLRDSFTFLRRKLSPDSLVVV